MEQSFSIPLRPIIQKPAAEPDLLPIRIAQINAQRGSFRNVTEQSLLEEVDAQRALGAERSEAEENEEAKERDVIATDRLEQLFKNRAEIVDFATQAHAEANYALDLVSLLVSKYTPRQAEISMSPYLKQRAPLGSLGIDVIKSPEKPEAAQKEIVDLSRGWKLANFDAAATKLLQAASRLEEEVAAETKYWAGVLDIKVKGWKVCRLPRERQTLGVHFGFLEATPTFRDRGLAALRRDNGGDLTLDRGLQASIPRSLRVRVQQDGEIVGISKLISLELAADNNNTIESRIRLARDALYEEELFHEINREARTLLQHGIESKHNLIQFQANDNQRIIIDMVSLDEGNASDLNQEEHVEDALAETVAQSLRLLLSHAHRQNYRHRTQTPPPITAKRRPNPEYSLLQPIVRYLQHKSALRWLKSLLDTITRTLQLAGLKCKYNIAPFLSVQLPSINKPTLPRSEPETPPFVERLVGSFLTPLESIVTGTFLSPTSSFKIRIVTNVGPNALGTEYEIATNMTSGACAKSRISRFGLYDDLQQLLLHVFTMDLVYLVPLLARDEGTDSSPPRTSSQLNQEQEQNDETGFCTPASLHPSNATTWTPTAPETASWSRSPAPTRWLGGGPGMDVEIERDTDVVHGEAAAGDVEAKQGSSGIVMYSWGIDSGNEEKTLRDVILLMSQEGAKQDM
ncbi:hypothetical protein ACJ72_01282 [Emergomyces africanus]|uniref:Mediator of RNA polymerase II transcription subunit 17 n=1 Tax=Emergomyces africanus TaxID=1955775 RepID=A0A1B7P5S5_9EURO|nr:hypothetical protein ACJ72_01282 [Emergomyces africanus]